MIWDLRGLVHLATDAMPGIIADDAVAELLGMLLDRRADVTDAAVHAAGLDAVIEAFFGHANQLFQLVRYLAHRQRHGGVADKPVESGGHIERHNVALLERLGFRK